MSRSDTQGFTLIELMITLALLTVVVTIAVPNFTAFIQKTRLQGQADDLAAFLQYARGEAVTKRTTATVTVDDDGPWIVTVNGEQVRQLEHNAEQAEMLSDVTAITYLSNGTANAAIIIICRNDVPETGYRIKVHPSGALERPKRGIKETGTDGTPVALTSCEP